MNEPPAWFNESMDKIYTKVAQQMALTIKII